MLELIIGCAALCGVGDEPYREWTSIRLAESYLPASTAQKLGTAELAALVARPPQVPYAEITSGIRLEDGTLWIAMRGGIARLAPGGSRWKLFHSRRWLPADEVLEIGATADQTISARTSAGAVRLSQKSMSLDDKMYVIQAALRRWHVREGLIGGIRLQEQGRPEAGYVQPSSDNDGLWTSLYVAAEVYRYAVTGDPEAKRNARQSLDALLFLERVTGISGFAARSIVPADDDPKKYGGQWHRSADGRWWWKGDTSSDELDGHYFAYALYFDLVAVDAEKKEIRGAVQRITDHILDHGLYYVGPSGKPTTWGVWAPEKLNHDLKWQYERGINSLEILSHLKVAEHIVGDAKYSQAAQKLIDEHSYAMNMVDQKHTWPDEVNHSDDELSFLAYYPLLIYERDPELRKFYIASIRRAWEVERLEQSPFLNFIYAAALQADEWTEPEKRPDAAKLQPSDYDRDACLAWLRLVPADTIEWSVHNSRRLDAGQRLANRFQKPQSDTLLPVDERRLMRWNGDPYELDGGSDGMERDDGTFILLPYWMGRYHRFIE